MHDIEPFYKWNELYESSLDVNSPYYGKEYDGSRYSNHVYNYYIHPLWDEIGSETLFVKILFADYDEGYSIIELIGEWNDCLTNDIMFLKRKLADVLIRRKINRFILLCDHVFNFHGSDDCYYEEWKEDLQKEGGYICLINIQEHLVDELKRFGLFRHVITRKAFQDLNWRKMEPQHLLEFVESKI